MSIWLFFMNLFGINVNSGSVDKLSDVAYDSQHERQTVDIYLPKEVPTIICHGDKDTIVPYQNAVDLANALTAAGIRNDFITYKNSGHDLVGDSDANSTFYSLYEAYAKEYFGY